jgi:hypothetical protein
MRTTLLVISVVCHAAPGAVATVRELGVRLSLDPAASAAAGAADWAPIVGWTAENSTADTARAVVQLRPAAGVRGENGDPLWAPALTEVAPQVARSHIGTTQVFFFATLSGLAPATQYIYRAGSAAGGFSRWFNLTTPPVAGSPAAAAEPWTFLAYGDMGTVDSVISRPHREGEATEASPDYTLSRLRSQEYDGAPAAGRRQSLRHELVLHVGDIVYGDYGYNLSQNLWVWDNFSASTEFMAAGRPYLICPGNHDFYSGACSRGR